MAQKHTHRPRITQTLRHFIAMDLLEASRIGVRMRMLLEASADPGLQIRKAQRTGPRAATDSSGLTHEFAAPEETLQEHLRDQLYRLPMDERQLLAGEWLIDLLDARGYLTFTVAAVTVELNTWLDKEDRQGRVPRFRPLEVAHVLEEVQNLEPAGVGARSLEECLLIQLRDRNLEDPLINSALTLCAEAVAAGNWEEVASRTGQTREAVRQIATLLDGLNPTPGSQFCVLIEGEPDGCFELIDGEPRAFLFQDDLIAAKRHGCEAQPMQRRADYLLEGLSRRHEILQRVLDGVVEGQRCALQRDLTHLRPLTRRRIGEQLGVHETVVDRAVKHARIQTPFGVLPLAAFFPPRELPGTTARLAPVSG